MLEILSETQHSGAPLECCSLLPFEATQTVLIDSQEHKVEISNSDGATIDFAIMGDQEMETPFLLNVDHGLLITEDMSVQLDPTCATTFHDAILGDVKFITGDAEGNMDRIYIGIPSFSSTHSSSGTSDIWYAVCFNQQEGDVELGYNKVAIEENMPTMQLSSPVNVKNITFKAVEEAPTQIPFVHYCM